MSALTRNILLAILVASTAAITYVVTLPDYEIFWTREVPSKQSITELSQALSDPSNWPVFTQALKSVKVQDTKSPFKVGSVITYEIEPVQKEWKRFTLNVEVLHWDGVNLHLKVLEDSKQKLAKIFKTLEWKLKLLPASPDDQKLGYQSRVYGEAVAFTKSWRSRLFGKLSPRILMHQVYYFDLMKLATFQKQKVAKEANLPPDYQ